MKTELSRRDVLRFSAIGAACLCGAPPLLRAATSDASAVALTKSGRVQGYLDRGISVFKGIPYGADPSKTPFRRADAPAPWKGVRPTVEFGPRAPQPPGHGVELFDFLAGRGFGR